MRSGNISKWETKFSEMKGVFLEVMSTLPHLEVRASATDAEGKRSVYSLVAKDCRGVQILRAFFVEPSILRIAQFSGPTLTIDASPWRDSLDHEREFSMVVKAPNHYVIVGQDLVLHFACASDPIFTLTAEVKA